MITASQWHPVGMLTVTRHTWEGEVMAVEVASDLGAMVRIEGHMSPETARRVASAMRSAGLQALAVESPIPYTLTEAS